jgi:hypothetical protein
MFEWWSICFAANMNGGRLECADARMSMFAAGMAVFLAALLWERQVIRAALDEQLGTDNTNHDDDSASCDRAAALGRTGAMIEWIGVIGAMGALGGLLVYMLGS